MRDVHRMVPRGIEVMIDQVEAIDLSSRSVRTSSGAMSYDFPIVSLGAELAPETLPGLSEAAYTFYTFDGATKLKAVLRVSQADCSHGSELCPLQMSWSAA